mmetsp:Transcript_6028/g.11428  ORF Transcript_6028/g.11428 Transcript_6028/m.11428 type:complete len:140 (+) Transcript_6028:374-793(+)
MDDTSQEWKTSLNATLNRLCSQYLNLLRAASSEHLLDDTPIDQRAGGQMTNANEPPPPLASSTALSTLATLIATENICASVNQLLDLIRILRLSVIVMGEERVQEEEIQCWEDGLMTTEICRETKALEDELRDLLSRSI